MICDKDNLQTSKTNIKYVTTELSCIKIIEFLISVNSNMIHDSYQIYR